MNKLPTKLLEYLVSQCTKEVLDQISEEKKLKVKFSKEKDSKFKPKIKKLSEDSRGIVQGLEEYPEFEQMMLSLFRDLGDKDQSVVQNAEGRLRAKGVSDFQIHLIKKRAQIPGWTANKNNFIQDIQNAYEWLKYKVGISESDEPSGKPSPQASSPPLPSGQPPA